MHFTLPASSKCALPPYSRTNLDSGPRDQLLQLASDYAKQRIAEAKLIFTGRAVSAKYVPIPDEHFGTYIITYKVDELLKGTALSYAKVAFRPDMFKRERRGEELLALVRSSPDAIYIADTVMMNALKDSEDSLDGQEDFCKSRIDRALKLEDESLPDSSTREYDDAIFRNALRVELRSLPRFNPNSIRWHLYPTRMIQMPFPIPGHHQNEGAQPSRRKFRP
jgi:hypothetical protein